MKKRGLPCSASDRPNGAGSGAARQPPSTWGSVCDIRADVGDEKLMTYGRFHAGDKESVKLFGHDKWKSYTPRSQNLPALSLSVLFIKLRVPP